MLSIAVITSIAAQDSIANVEVRVWQSTHDAESLYISARQEGGSWAALGTIPLDMSGLNSRETFRYGDITLPVSVPPSPFEPELRLEDLQCRVLDDGTLYLSGYVQNDEEQSVYAVVVMGSYFPQGGGSQLGHSLAWAGNYAAGEGYIPSGGRGQFGMPLPSHSFLESGDPVSCYTSVINWNYVVGYKDGFDSDNRRHRAEYIPRESSESSEEESPLLSFSCEFQQSNSQRIYDLSIDVMNGYSFPVIIESINFEFDLRDGSSFSGSELFHKSVANGTTTTLETQFSDPQGNMTGLEIATVVLQAAGGRGTININKSCPLRIS